MALSSVLVIAIPVIVVLGVMYFNLRVTESNAELIQKQKQCFAFHSIEIYQAATEDLKNADIKFNSLSWTPSQSALNELGTANKVPLEIWIERSSAERAIHVLTQKYGIITKEYAIVVTKKI